VLNAKIESLTCLDEVFIPPAPDDSGISLGAVCWYTWKKYGMIPKFKCNPYLGSSFSDEEISQAIDCFANKIQRSRVDDVTKKAAESLMKGEVIGWFQGRSEFSPRSLGNRSILASPINPWNKDILNHTVKLREWFRPFAPSIRLEDVPKYFVSTASPYMMKVAKAKNIALSTIPSCIHVDGTSRLQTVSREQNLHFHKLISHFFELSNIPIVLNTSFNLAGMPIVESPTDAIECFISASNLDKLFIGNFVVTRV
jgi:carbamoyltransferase